MLYLIEILHQTTTFPPVVRRVVRCILSKFYIKPQLRLERELTRCSCILSKFYIKPQPPIINSVPYRVVSYRNSTSNHNSGTNPPFFRFVVSYRNSTSNHNVLGSRTYRRYVVSYRNSTSNHNIYVVRSLIAPLYLIEILHQTTTTARPMTST